MCTWDLTSKILIPLLWGATWASESSNALGDSTIEQRLDTTALSRLLSQDNLWGGRGDKDLLLLLWVILPALDLAPQSWERQVPRLTDVLNGDASTTLILCFQLYRNYKG